MLSTERGNRVCDLVFGYVCGREISKMKFDYFAMYSLHSMLLIHKGSRFNEGCRIHE